MGCLQKPAQGSLHLAQRSLRRGPCIYPQLSGIDPDFRKEHTSCTRFASWVSSHANLLSSWPQDHLTKFLGVRHESRGGRRGGSWCKADDCMNKSIFTLAGNRGPYV
jgi:hypothetical protein